MSDEPELEKFAEQIVVCTKCEFHRSREKAVPEKKKKIVRSK